MPYGLLADLVVVAHLGFILFAVAGGLLALAWPRVAWLHLPAVAWAVVVEVAGWICPLTPLENRLRALAGSAGYREGFVDHYIVPVVYPEGLDRSLQIGLGVGLAVLNAAVYGWLWRRRRRPRLDGSRDTGAEPPSAQVH